MVHFQYQFGDDLKEHLLNKITKNLEETASTNCGRVSQIFVKQLSKQLEKREPTDLKTN